MSKGGGNAGKLRYMGLTNHDTPDLSELMGSEFTRGGMRGFCSSQYCARHSTSRRGVQIMEAKYPAERCPKCGHALVWHQPPRARVYSGRPGEDPEVEA
jgi:hypothetical protein